MRLLTFEHEGQERVGLRIGEQVVDLSIAAPHLPRTLRGLIEAGAIETLAPIAADPPQVALKRVSTLHYLPLIPTPSKLLGVGRNYGSHVGDRPATPGFFLSSPTRLCAHKDAVRRPTDSLTLDFEIELAVIIGRRATRVSARDALEYVAGYSIFNDGSVRGYFDGTPYTLALQKNADKTGVLGPEMVTPDELPPGGVGLRLITRRNGCEVQNDTTSNMFWSIPEIIEMCSKHMTLEPGDIVTTGTPGGTVADVGRSNGFDIWDENLDFLRDGEELEFEIPEIGILSCRVENATD